MMRLLMPDWTSPAIRKWRALYLVLTILVMFNICCLLKNFYVERYTRLKIPLLMPSKLTTITLHYVPTTASHSTIYLRNSTHTNLHPRNSSSSSIHHIDSPLSILFQESLTSSVPQRKNLVQTQNWRNLTQKEIKSLSVLSRRLFLEENIGTEQKRNFTILAWNQRDVDAERLIREFENKKLDPFRFCSVKNCKLVTEDSYAKEADAIVFHLHRTNKTSTYPPRANYLQRWIWLKDEISLHTLYFTEDKDISQYNGIFNWSMGYSMDSDVPVPYGRAVRMTDREASAYEKADYFNIKTKLAAGMITSCDVTNYRTGYVRQLRKYMDIDIYGGCFKLKLCQDHYNKECVLLNDYKFFLAFENSNCQEYITEKVWWQAIQKGAIPIVMGPKIEDYRKILPPNSFIHVNDFDTPYHLANYLKFLEQNRTKFMEYHEWRSRLKVLNEHSYYGSHHYCRVCEALNYNDPSPKVYDHMEVFWSNDTRCNPATWDARMRRSLFYQMGFKRLRPI